MKSLLSWYSKGSLGDYKFWIQPDGKLVTFDFSEMHTQLVPEQDELLAMDKGWVRGTVENNLTALQFALNNNRARETAEDFLIKHPTKFIAIDGRSVFITQNNVVSYKEFVENDFKLRGLFRFTLSTWFDNPRDIINPDMKIMDDPNALTHIAKMIMTNKHLGEFKFDYFDPYAVTGILDTGKVMLNFPAPGRIGLFIRDADGYPVVKVDKSVTVTLQEFYDSICDAIGQLHGDSPDWIRNYF